MESTLFTIGHSNLDIDSVKSALREYGIDAVVDVRSQPYSKFSPQFNKNDLAASLKDSNIAYAFMGRELGGRPDNRAYYDAEGYVRYDLWSQDEAFQEGIRRLLKGAAERRIALLCSEEDPAHCHRHLLIARVLNEGGFPGANILHIRALATEWGCIQDDEIPRQRSLFGEELAWRSPQSVLHKVLRSTSSSDSDALEFADSSTFG